MCILRNYHWFISICILVLLMMVSCIPTEPPSPLGPAFANGKPTLAEFGLGICTPCKEMAPILEEVSREYQGTLNVVVIEVDKHFALTDKYNVMTLPTQIFFDSAGNEVMRHVGFLPEEDIADQLKKMGVR
jgi:thioredoxin 1